MVHSPAFTFSSGYPLGFCRVPGFAFRQCASFKPFLASIPCSACATSYHFSSIASSPWRTAFSRFAPVVNLGFPVLASGSNCAVKPTRLRRAAYFRSLVCSVIALFSPCFFYQHSPSQAFIRWVFCCVPGFAFLGCASFKPFWPLALVQQALAAIILQALRRFRGAVLIRGLRTSSSWGFPFWLLGLTLRSSGPAFCGPLTLAVSLPGKKK